MASVHVNPDLLGVSAKTTSAIVLKTRASRELTAQIILWMERQIVKVAPRVILEMEGSVMVSQYNRDLW